MKKNFLPLVGIFAFILASCSDSTPVIDNNHNNESTNTLLILNEGAMNQNNASLSLYDIEDEKLNANFFREVNNRDLGDLGADMIKYGSKIYITLGKSSTIEILNAATGKSLKQISMKTESGTSKEPNKLVAHDGKVYVTSYDDTVTRIDTLTMSVDGSVNVGRDPEGICVVGNKLYVANSGGLDYMANNHDNTVSVIDIKSFEEVEKIEVGKNPYELRPDSKGNIYLSTRAIYNGQGLVVAPASLKRLNTVTKKVEDIEDIVPSKFVIVDDVAYIIIDDFIENIITTYDCNNNKIIKENILPSGLEMKTPYCITIGGLTGNIYISESDYSTPGNVHCFDKDGELKYSISATGINPTIVIEN